MSPFYPQETKKLDVIGHLEELRKRILFSLIVICIASVIAFWKGNFLMTLVKEPIRDLADELIFLSPTEAFIAYIKVALLSGFIISFPVILYHLWAFLFPALSGKVKGRISLWLGFAFILFFSGIAFSYYIAIPAALNFLIKFGSEIASPRIALGKYISFFGALILVGGLIFEIPIIIGLLTDTGILKTSILRKKRHYAILVIMIIAAIITPTQDIFNMLLFAVPMMLLYETGIIIGLLIELKKRNP